MFGTGTVRSIYKNNGVVLCNVTDESTGAVYIACPLLSLGAGTDDNHLFSAPRAGSLVLLGLFRGRSSKAVVLGCLPTSMAKKISKDREYEGDGDYPVKEAVHLADTAMRNKGAVVAVTKDGNIVLDATESQQPVRVQLAPSGQLRVSQGGVEPTEHTLLAGPTIALLEELVDKVNALVTAIDNLRACAATAAKKPVIGEDIGIALLNAPLPIAIAEPGDSLIADALLISENQLSEESTESDIG